MAWFFLEELQDCEWYGDFQLEVDHQDHNKTNASIGNLRLANTTQNHQYMLKQKNKSSRYKGVSWNKQNKRWHACITLFGQTKYLGYFRDEVEAAQAYDEAAKEHFGWFAHTNF